MRGADVLRSPSGRYEVPLSKWRPLQNGHADTRRVARVSVSKRIYRFTFVKWPNAIGNLANTN